MKGKKLFAALTAAVSLSVALTVFSGATASADLPFCMGTYNIQASNGGYVSHRENEGGVIKVVTSGGALGTWERFRLFRHALDPNGNKAYAIRASDDKWLVVDTNNGGVIWGDYSSTPSGFPHEWTYKFNGTSEGPSGGFQPFKALVNGLWVTNEENHSGIVAANRTSVGSWEQFRWVQLNTSCQLGS